MCISDDEPNNVLIIDFKGRTALYFDINPEALILPLEVSTHYIGETRGARKSKGLAAEKGKRETNRQFGRGNFTAPALHWRSRSFTALASRSSAPRGSG